MIASEGGGEEWGRGKGTVCIVPISFSLQKKQDSVMLAEFSGEEDNVPWNNSVQSRD